MKNALFDIIGQTEEKYIARSEKRFAPHKGVEITAQTLRIAGAAASVILIISFAVLMWIIADNNRDPVASTDTTHGTAAVTGTDANTDPADPDGLQYYKVYTISNYEKNEYRADYLRGRGVADIPTVNEVKEINEVMKVIDYPSAAGDNTDRVTADFAFLGGRYENLYSTIIYRHSLSDEDIDAVNRSDNEYLHCFTSYRVYQTEGTGVTVWEALGSGEIISFRIYANRFPDHVLSDAPVDEAEAEAKAIETAKILGKTTEGYTVAVEPTELIDPGSGNTYVSYNVTFKKKYNDNISTGYVIGVTNGGFINYYKAYNAWYKDTGYTGSAPTEIRRIMNEAVTKYQTEVMPENTQISYIQSIFSRRFSDNGDTAYICHVIFYEPDTIIEWGAWFVMFVPEREDSSELYENYKTYAVLKYTDYLESDFQSDFPVEDSCVSLVGYMNSMLYRRSDSVYNDSGRRYEDKEKDVVFNCGAYSGIYFDCRFVARRPSPFEARGNVVSYTDYGYEIYENDEAVFRLEEETGEIVGYCRKNNISEGRSYSKEQATEEAKAAAEALGYDLSEYTVTVTETPDRRENAYRINFFKPSDHHVYEGFYLVMSAEKGLEEYSVRAMYEDELGEEFALSQTLPGGSLDKISAAIDEWFEINVPGPVETTGTLDYTVQRVGKYGVPAAVQTVTFYGTGFRGEVVFITVLPEDYAGGAQTGPDINSDKEEIEALFKLIMNGGYTEENWQKLLSYGDTGFEYLAQRKRNTKEEHTVISVYFGELLKDEAAASGDVSLCGVSFPTVSALQKQPVDTGYYQAFSTYLSYAKKYAKYHRRDDMAARMPVTSRLLALYGFTDYYFDVETDDYDYCADIIMAIKDQQERSEARHRFISARSDEITERFYNGRDTEQNEERKAFTDSLFISIFREDLYIYPDIGEARDEFSRAYGASNVTYDELVELMKKDASELYEVELSEYKPSVKRFLDYIGFDGYKKDPDIAMRSFLAIKNSIEFYNVVVEGDMPPRLGWQLGVKNHEKVPEEDFYAYFEQYLPSDVVRNFVRNSESFYYEDGGFICGLGNPVAWINAGYKHARIVSEKNGVTTLSVSVGFPEGMSVFEREMTYDVVEDENGVRIIGGSFIDQILKPYIGAAHEISNVLNLYFKLREGQVGPEYNDNADRIFNSYDEVTDYYKDVIKTDTEFPVCYYPRYLFCKNEIYTKLYESNPVFDGILIYPGKATHKTVPAFEYERTAYGFGDEELKTVSPYDVMRAMKVIEYTKDSVTVMLDFIREENGKKENVTYTFVLSCDNSGASHYSYCYTLTGGTFVTECIYDNTGTAVNADLVKIYINEKPTGMMAEKVKDGEYMIPFASLMQYISRLVRWESAAVCTFIYADKEYYIDVLNRTAGPADNRNADYITLPPGSDYGYDPYRTEGLELYVEANIVFCFFKTVLDDLESDLSHFEEYGDGINIYVAVEDFSAAANM